MNYENVLFFSSFLLGMHLISGWPDIRPDYPALFKDLVSGRIPDLMAGYPARYRILQLAEYIRPDIRYPAFR
jgi:hypothetical protein